MDSSKLDNLQAKVVDRIMSSIGKETMNKVLNYVKKTAEQEATRISKDASKNDLDLPVEGLLRRDSGTCSDQNQEEG